MRTFRPTTTMIALGILMGAATAATADPIQTRQALMWANGANGGVAGEMLKGNIPFDPKVAGAVLATFSATAQSFPDYFPEGSKSGHDTRAKDTIWSDPEGFATANAEFAEATAAAVAAEPADLDAFKVVFGPIGKACGSCHETYRVPRN